MKPETNKEAEKEKFKAALRAKGSQKIETVGASQPIKPEEITEEEPVLFPDIHWVWTAFCFLNERRQVGPNGPQPVSAEAIYAYAKLSNRTTERNRENLLRFIPALDRVFLSDFYDKQAKEYAEIKKKQEQAARRATVHTGRR